MKILLTRVIARYLVRRLGVQPPTPIWATMLDAGRSHLLDALHRIIFPDLAIALLVLGFTFLGDGLRDRRGRSSRSADA